MARQGCNDQMAGPRLRPRAKSPPPLAEPPKTNPVVGMKRILGTCTASPAPTASPSVGEGADKVFHQLGLRVIRAIVPPRVVAIKNCPLYESF